MPQSRKVITLFDDYYDMMSDPVRMTAYGEAIRAVVRPGDVVVDLGAGLGILGFLCLSAGASKVYAIEKMGSIDLARQVAADNGLADRVVFVEGSSKASTLPEKADLLVSETLGSFAVDENTVDFTIDARRRFLKPEGRLLPRRLRCFLSPVENAAGHARLAFWEDVGGVRYTAAVQQKLSRLSVEKIRRESLLAPPALFADVDLRLVESPALERRMRFEIQRAGTLHGLGGWFEAELSEGVLLDTAPGRPSTHWKQAFFPFREPVRVSEGDFLELVMSVRPKSPESDDTIVSYQYFCSQKGAGGAEAAPARNSPCPCGSGKKHKRCCGRA